MKIIFRTVIIFILVVSLTACSKNVNKVEQGDVNKLSQLVINNDFEKARKKLEILKKRQSDFGVKAILQFMEALLNYRLMNRVFSAQIVNGELDKNVLINQEFILEDSILLVNSCIDNRYAKDETLNGCKKLKLEMETMLMTVYLFHCLGLVTLDPANQEIEFTCKKAISLSDSNAALLFPYMASATLAEFYQTNKSYKQSLLYARKVIEQSYKEEGTESEAKSSAVALAKEIENALLAGPLRDNEK
jgi:hypothetical protein